MANTLKICLFILFLQLVVWTTNASSVEKELTLTRAQKQILDKFKRKMIPILPHNYMKNEFYLIRWLKARNFDLAMAEQMLKSNLRWRREQKIDQIENEDWADMKLEYPYTSDKTDKQGRPIGTANLGSWNFRRIAVAGKMPRLHRYLTKLLEEGMTLVHEQQRKGYNVTQFKLLLNLDGFNQIQHACPICLPAYTNFVSAYEDRYPGYCEQAIHVNTPPVYDIVLNAIRPLLSSTTRSVIKIFGTDKTQWMRYLDKEISRDQRRVEFGGILRD